MTAMKYFVTLQFNTGRHPP